MTDGSNNSLKRRPDPEQQAHQALLAAIQEHLPQFEELLRLIEYEYEDRLYRFYDQSNKVYYLQDDTLRTAEQFREIGRIIDRKLNPRFEQIITNGTGLEFDVLHNDDWLRHTRPLVEAFLHIKYFVEMMVKYGRELETAPNILPSGWAAILTLYNMR